MFCELLQNRWTCNAFDFNHESLAEMGIVRVHIAWLVFFAFQGYDHPESFVGFNPFRVSLRLSVFFSLEICSRSAKRFYT